MLNTFNKNYANRLLLISFTFWSANSFKNRSYNRKDDPKKKCPPESINFKTIYNIRCKKDDKSIDEN